MTYTIIHLSDIISIDASRCFVLTPLNMTSLDIVSVICMGRLINGIHIQHRSHHTLVSNLAKLVSYRLFILAAFTLSPVLFRILANRTRRVDLASGRLSVGFEFTLQTTDPTRTVRAHFAVYTLRLLRDGCDPITCT